MNGALGHSAVLLGLLGSAAGAVTLVVGLVQGRPRLLRVGASYPWMVLAGAVLAVLAMQRALLTDDFSLDYIANHHSRSTPTLFTITSMWSALEGSILLWGLVLAIYLVAVRWRFRDRIDDPLVGWALATAMVVSTFFFLLILGPADPFRHVAGAIPLDGPGPNPLLQNHLLVAFHPPILYAGYVGFTVPFSFAVAALVTGRVGEGWLLETRRWTLVSWGFLTIGIVLGAWWSYEVLGWGGYWAWDPVENASFLPWLTGTAFLHSVLVQERRGMFRVWNLSLVIATFSLTILGTFLTRSGVLDSVHAFSESPIGPWVLSFFGLVVAVGLGLIAWRGDALRSPGAIDSPVSREGFFLANNLLFAAFAFVVLLGTVFPLIVEAVRGDRLTVGRPYFDRMTIPVALALLFLMAVAPALPWRKASTGVLSQRLLWPAWSATIAVALCVALGARGLETVLAFGLGAFAAAAAIRQLALAARRQGWRGLVGRTNGGMIVHLGVVVVAVAIAASGSFTRKAEVTLAPGASKVVLGHRVTYLGSEDKRYRNRQAVEAKVQIDGGRVDRPALSTFPFATQAIGTPSVKTGVRYDVYLTLLRAAKTPEGSVVIGIRLIPLAVWLWIGGGIMAVGTLLSLVPGRRRRPTAPASAPPLDEAKPDASAPRRSEEPDDDLVEVSAP